jgi:hypothetical protein
MLAVTSRSEGGQDAYAIPVARLADAWPEVLGVPPAMPVPGRAFTVDDAKAGVFVGRRRKLASCARWSASSRYGDRAIGCGQVILGQRRARSCSPRRGWIARVRLGGMPADALAEGAAEY